MQLPEDIYEIYKTAECIFTKKEVEKALDEMAVSISESLSDTNPIFLCVVIGGIIPVGNLLPRLDFPLEVDYIHVSRYRGKTSGGELWWKVTPTTSLKGRTVVVVDDILDGGITLASVINYCYMEEAKKVFSAVLVDKKKSIREPNGLNKADFHGLVVDDRFDGLDYDGLNWHQRNET